MGDLVLARHAAETCPILSCMFLQDLIVQAMNTCAALSDCAQSPVTWTRTQSFENFFCANIPRLVFVHVCIIESQFIPSASKKPLNSKKVSKCVSIPMMIILISRPKHVFFFFFFFFRYTYHINNIYIYIYIIFISYIYIHIYHI